MHTQADLFVCLFCQILSALIRFLSTGTGFQIPNPVSYQPEPEFWKVIPVSYQPEFRQSTGIPVLNPVPAVPYSYRVGAHLKSESEVVEVAQEK